MEGQDVWCDKGVVRYISDNRLWLPLPDTSLHVYDSVADQVVVVCRKKADGYTLDKCSVHPDYYERWKR
jgi:hypothetical protein